MFIGESWRVLGNIMDYNELTEIELDQLSSLLFDEVNNLVQGWSNVRSCEAHNLITFCVWYCMNTSGGVGDLICCDKGDIHKTLNEYRYPKYDSDLEENCYLWWHNQSRDITDYADKYEGKTSKDFVKDLIKHYRKVYKLYGL